MQFVNGTANENAAADAGFQSAAEDARGIVKMIINYSTLITKDLVL